MANYFLKNATGAVAKMYRVEYLVNGSNIRVTGASVTGADLTLPDGTTVSGIDEEVSVTNVLVDVVLVSVVAGTVGEYGTLVDSLVTSQWG